MLYYVIYNSTVLNYSNNNKNLNTFIYGTVLYILSHGLINSYDNQFARYIKSYFWIILAIDIFCIYYLHNNINININPDIENEANSLKSILNTFYNTKKTKEENQTEPKEPKEPKQSPKKNTEENNIIEDDNLEEPIAYSPDDDFNLPNDLPTNLSNNNVNNNVNNNIDIDQMSDSGSDIDLDNFEISLQN